MNKKAYYWLSGEAAGPPPATALLPALTPYDAKYLRQVDGTPFTAIECSDFNLLAVLQQQGEAACRKILAQRAACGFNMVRVWTKYRITGIGDFLDIDYSLVPKLVHIAAEYKVYVEYTAYTGTLDTGAHFGNLVAQLQQFPKGTVLLELTNEGDHPGNYPDGNPDFFKTFVAPVGVFACRGSNSSEAWPQYPYWDYGAYHTNGAFEFQRKVGHNAMEIPVRTLSNENTRFPDNDSSLTHAYDAAAGAALLCVGSCFHSVRGKSSQLWDGVELECAKAWAQGARSVNLICQDYPYEHIPDGMYLRVYRCGPVVVSIRY